MDPSLCPFQASRRHGGVVCVCSFVLLRIFFWLVRLTSRLGPPKRGLYDAVVHLRRDEPSSTASRRRRSSTASPYAPAAPAGIDAGAAPRPRHEHGGRASRAPHHASSHKRLRTATPRSPQRVSVAMISCSEQTWSKILSFSLGPITEYFIPVSYTHLTLPTN